MKTIKEKPTTKEKQKNPPISTQAKLLLRIKKQQQNNFKTI